MIGFLTNLLKAEYIKAGYRLQEDDDFIYLYQPGVKDPHVFSSRGATIASIESHIKILEGVNV
jgi:hypothetical protein